MFSASNNKEKLLFPMSLIFGVIVFGLIISLAVFARQAGLDKNLGARRPAPEIISKIKTDTRTYEGVGVDDRAAKRDAVLHIWQQFDKDLSCSKWEPFADDAPRPGTVPEDIAEDEAGCKVPTEKKCNDTGNVTGCVFALCEANDTGPGKKCEATCYFECGCNLECTPMNPI